MERHGLQRKYKAGAVGFEQGRRRRRPTNASGAVRHHSPTQATKPVEAITQGGDLIAGISVAGLIGRVRRTIFKKWGKKA